MAQVGRPRQPKLENNTRHAVTKISVPKCPAYLCRVGKSYWKQTIDELLELGTLSKLDGNQIATYCDACARYVRCSQIERSENYTPKERSIAAMGLHRAASQQLSYAKELGLTSASRSKLVIPTDDHDEKWAGATGLLGKK